MSSTGPIRLASPSGIVVEVNANGSIRRIDHDGVIVNAYLGSELEGGPANLILRRRGARIDWIPLLGPRSPGAVRLDADGLEVVGTWGTLRFSVSLALAKSAPAWFWHVAIENAGREPVTVDLIHSQDVALADYGAVRLNEYYVSQYLDFTPLDHPVRGAVLAVRQNLAVGGRHPWLALGSLGRAASFATDALQLHGLATRAGETPIGLAADRLPGVRRQHEHAMAVLQDEPVTLAPGARAARGFFAWLEPDHPDRSSAADLSRVERALALPDAAPPAERAAALAVPRAATLFSDAPTLAAGELDEAALAAHWPGERRAVESADGTLLSFFTADGTHVVLPAKERACLRPHGQILRTGDRLEPDEASLTTTVWMGGFFHSMVTQGHVSIGRLLSTTHGYLGLFRAHGLRVFAELGDGWQLLDLPSAFAMTPSGARWLYRHTGGLIEVRSWAAVHRHELGLAIRVLAGAPCRFLLSHSVALGGDDGADARPVHFERDARGVAVLVPPDSDLGRRFPDGRFRLDPAPGTTLEHVGGDELLFADGRSRRQPYLVMVTAPSAEVGLRLTGQLVGGAPDAAPASAGEQSAADAAAAAAFWRDVNGSLTMHGPPAPSARAAVERLDVALPWLAHDAWIHHLAPRGLEQYSGGGWGTRDVCQGPVELWLALGRVAPVRDLLLEVFRNQNADGDWPQWFQFFERERHIRPSDSHGDIVFWPLLALAQYLLAWDDAAFLDIELPFFRLDGTEGSAEGADPAERATVLGHVERALALIERRVVPGTRLAAYGNGDWNDALQPVDPALAERLCSAWTVTLHYQTVATLAQALRGAGHEARAAALEASLVGVRADFQRLLVADGVVTGLACFDPDGRVEHWLHPRDGATGVHYSLLPMIHGILAGLFTPVQAAHHIDVIRRHLLAPDGARLFDRPLPYRGGLAERFQRAETSSFFGREIGLLYTHAHLRWAEALAHLGEGEAFFLALQQGNPAGLRDVVPNARPRQANCYTSSSDADFPDRYAASARYDEVTTGTVAVEGGWRVYSSGAGIAVRLVRERLLGLRPGRATLGLDPVLPRALDGLRVGVVLAGRPIELSYRVGALGHGPKALALNGSPLSFVREAHPYREGGAVVTMDLLRERLRDAANHLVVELG
jgi:cellobiose phosphorylase